MSSIDASPITDGINGLLTSGKGLLGNPIATGIGGAAIGAAITGTTLGILSSVKKKSKRKAPAKRRKTVKKRKRASPKRKRPYKYARTAGKRKDRSTRRIRMTKNGQPYVILKSGKARFIKKSSARRSRKLKGGRY